MLYAVGVPSLFASSERGMQTFQPLGFSQQVLNTSLGVMAYYTPGNWPWVAEKEALSQRPPLIFLHSLGGGSSAFEWSKVYVAFADSYRVIAPDLVGWGQSTHPTRSYTVDDYFYLITHLIENLTEPPVPVVATSLTAGVVIRLAIQRPDLFQKLFFVSPTGNSDFGRDYTMSLPAQLARTPGLDKLIYTLGAANELAVTSFLSNFLFANPNRITPEIVQAYLAGTQQPNAEFSALSSLNGTVSFDLSLYIRQLRIPTAFVLGQRSRFSPVAVVKRLASLNPTAIQWVKEIPDSGVLPHLEHPALVVALLQQWLNRPAETNPES
jgi:pimeloyl-ACP methyl ester carboxylesterase